MDLRDAITLVEGFRAGVALRERLSNIEDLLQGANALECHDQNHAVGVTAQVLAAANALKIATAQLHEVIHALGILLCLPHVLEAHETVQALSLGAGNTGKPYDLETNARIAEFTFIRWRGGAETIRQNKVFKDFFMLAEAKSAKRKVLYLVDEERPKRFLYTSRRKLDSVLKDHSVREEFYASAGRQFETVHEYVATRRGDVEIRDVSAWLPELVLIAAEQEASNEAAFD
jgi:hypothetical protein